MTWPFYADPALGGSGRTYTEADFDPYDYVEALPAILTDAGAMITYAQTQASAAAASALTAVNAPGTSATSTTSNTVGTGSKTWTIQTGKAFAVGQYVVIADTSAAATNFMLGRITAHNSGTGSLTVSVASSTGSGTLTAWTISISADPGASVGTSRTLTAAGLVAGGGDLSANRTFTVTAAVAADHWTGTSATTAVTPSGLLAEQVSQSLTDGATITPDFGAGRNFHVTLGGNRTLANPTNLAAGQSGRFRIVQDGTGSRTLAFGTKFKKPGGTITLSTAAGSVDVIPYYVHDTNNIELGLLKALS